MDTSKEKVKEQIKTQWIKTIREVQDHYKKETYPLDAKFLVEDILHQVTGMDVLGYALFNTPTLTKKDKIRLKIEYHGDRWYIIPVDQVAFYYNPSKNEIVPDVDDRDMTVFTNKGFRYGFYPREWEFIGFL